METGELLEQLREQAGELEEHDDDVVVEFARLFQRLDGRLSKGGALPDDWDGDEDDDTEDEDDEDEVA